jgi:hypothetical protein
LLNEPWFCSYSSRPQSQSSARLPQLSFTMPAGLTPTSLDS